MYREILDFWFDELQPQQWWVKDEKLDLLIRERFLNIYEQAKSVNSLPGARRA